MKTNESGYAKLVANFENLYTHCTSFGTTYSPSYASIQLSGLATKLSNARSALNAVQLAKTAYNDATNAREILFAGIPKFATRIISALIACNATQQRIDDARTVIRKIKGERAGKSTTTDTSREAAPIDPGSTPAPVGGAVEGPGRRSVSQRSYEGITENFAQLVIIVTAEPMYSPMETDLTVAALNNLVSQLRAINTAVFNTGVQYENARFNRDNELYHVTSGLVNIARQAKLYVRSLFGTTSPQFKSISGIRII
jgi:hypothetical protein